MEKLGKPKNGNAMEANDKARPAGVGGVHGEYENELSTSSYESLNFINDDVVGLPCLRRKGVTKVTQELRELSLASLPTSCRKFYI